jgi:hypothetical protein
MSLNLEREGEFFSFGAHLPALWARVTFKDQFWTKFYFPIEIEDIKKSRTFMSGEEH